MVENPAEAGIELVDRHRRKHVGLGKSQIPAMIVDELIAADAVASDQLGEPPGTKSVA